MRAANQSCELDPLAVLLFATHTHSLHVLATDDRDRRLTATALVLESNRGGKTAERVFLVSVDLGWQLARALRVIMRYELQQTEPNLSAPVHVVRIGDLAIATNPFELYLDYGMQIKARSKALQTMTVQLANGYFRYPLCGRELPVLTSHEALRSAP